MQVQKTLLVLLCMMEQYQMLGYECRARIDLYRGCAALLASASMATNYLLFSYYGRI
jgi:hypothetical protein